MAAEIHATLRLGAGPEAARGDHAPTATRARVQREGDPAPSREGAASSTLARCLCRRPARSDSRRAGGWLQCSPAARAPRSATTAPRRSGASGTSGAVRSTSPYPAPATRAVAGIRVHRRHGLDATLEQGHPGDQPEPDRHRPRARASPNASSSGSSTRRTSSTWSTRSAASSRGRERRGRSEPGPEAPRHERTFVLTDSELERRFVPIARRAGLSQPETQVRAERAPGRLLLPRRGHRRRDRRRPLPPHPEPAAEGPHPRPGATAGRADASIRFTHDQIAHEPAYVADVLRRLSSKA